MSIFITGTLIARQLRRVDINTTICYKNNRNKCPAIKSKFQGAACKRVCWNKLRFKIEEQQIPGLK